MKFECIYEKKSKKENWMGKIKNLKTYDSSYEFVIESRSWIMVIYGETSRGFFACMPDYNKGCHLVNWNDRFWNREKLTKILGTVDGITVESALYNYFKSTNK